MMLYKQQISGKRDDMKIVLSLEVYNRLHGLMCLSSYFSHITGKLEEYGQFIFGRKCKDGIFFFDQTEHPGNSASNGAYHPTDEDVEDTITKLMSDRFDCFANVHTHPAYNECGRCFSEPDIKEYTRMTDFKKGCLFLGCMISQPVIGDWSADEISFISIDKNDQSYIYYPNIYVALGTKLVPLEKQTDLIYIGKDNRPYNKIDLRNDIKVDDVYAIERTTMSF